MNVIRQRSDLSDLVVIRQHRQDRLVKSSREYLRPALSHEGLEHVDEFRVPLFKETVEDACVVQGYPDLRMPLQYREKRQISLLICFFRDKVEIPYRLVVMNGKDELYLGHFDGYRIQLLDFQRFSNLKY